MSKRNAPSSWIPLIQYANERGVSLSTLRRHIKAKKIEFKIENGRYLIFDENFTAPPMDIRSVSAPATPVTQLESVHLKADLRKAREEIVELKTLIALYEEKITGHANSRR